MKEHEIERKMMVKNMTSYQFLIKRRKYSYTFIYTNELNFSVSFSFFFFW
jgi:hypothetical protein